MDVYEGKTRPKDLARKDFCVIERQRVLRRNRDTCSMSLKGPQDSSI